MIDKKVLNTKTCGSTVPDQCWLWNYTYPKWRNVDTVTLVQTVPHYGKFTCCIRIPYVSKCNPHILKDTFKLVQVDSQLGLLTLEWTPLRAAGVWAQNHESSIEEALSNLWGWIFDHRLAGNHCKFPFRNLNSFFSSEKGFLQFFKQGFTLNVKLHVWVLLKVINSKDHYFWTLHSSALFHRTLAIF